MTEEDEEFNRIEREAKLRMQAVSAALEKKAENARELGLDYEPPQRTWQGLTDYERTLIHKEVGYNQFMTAGEYAERVQKATESLLKAKNS